MRQLQVILRLTLLFLGRTLLFVTLVRLALVAVLGDIAGLLARRIAGRLQSIGSRHLTAAALRPGAFLITAC